MKLIKDLYKNEYLLSVLSRILLTLIGVFHSVFIARFLGPELKGVTATIQSYIGILAIFMTLGLQEVYPYYRRQMTDEFILQRYTTLVKLIFFVFESFSFLCIFIMHFHLELTNAFALVISPITAYATIISYIYLIENAIKRNIVFVIISFFETFIVLILMLFVKANYFWVFIIVSFSDIVKAVYFTVKLKVKFDFRLINISFLLSTIKRGIFPMIALVLTGLNYKIDIIMLNGFDNVNMSDIGIYSVGVALADKTVYIPEAVREILLSKLTKGADKFEVAKVIRWCLFISGLTLFF